MTDPLGHGTTTTYDGAGEALTVTDPLSRVTTYSYNVRGWKYTAADPLGNVTTYGYTATGKSSSVTQKYSSGGASEAYAYDRDDHLLTFTDALQHVTTYGYDSGGNRTTVTDPNGNTTTYVYDSRNRVIAVTDPLSHTTSYGYDSGGNRITVTDPLLHTTTTQYDALNRATTVTDARNAVTTLAYDAAGRNTVVVDPDGNRTTFGYDAADRLTTMTDPLNHSTTSSYDADNELTDKTDRDGRRTTYSYDSGGRRTGETWVAASPSEVITFTYDADNELTGAADANATLTFTYDSGGNQLTAATSGPGTGQPALTLTSAYDPTHDRTSLSDNLGSAGVTTSLYDAAFRLTTVAVTYGGTAGPQVVYGYDSGGRVTSASRTIGGSGTAVNTSFSYDNADRVTTLTHQSVSGGTTTPLATYVYGYDSANRVTTEVNAEGTVTYGYDATNELTSANGSRTESYSYDSGGNRTMTGYTTGTGNELTASPGTTYAYDAEGNLTSQTNTSTHVVTTYSYDYHNRLTGVSVGGTAVATYVYDALDRRIGFKDNGTQTWTVYDGVNPYADFNGSGTLLERYLDGAAVDQVLARTSSGGTSNWYLTDRLGTVRDITASSGTITTVLDHISYDSFGDVLTESSPSNGDRFKFAGMEYDAATGQYYDRARWYAPVVGRFTAQDPKGFRAGDINLYRYATNGPTDGYDPTGKDVIVQINPGVGTGSGSTGSIGNPDGIQGTFPLGSPVGEPPPDGGISVSLPYPGGSSISVPITGPITGEPPTLSISGPGSWSIDQPPGQDGDPGDGGNSGEGNVNPGGSIGFFPPGRFAPPVQGRTSVYTPDPRLRGGKPVAGMSLGTDPLTDEGSNPVDGGTPGVPASSAGGSSLGGFTPYPLGPPAQPVPEWSVQHFIYVIYQNIRSLLGGGENS